MTNSGFIALRGQHSFHMVDRKIIKEVEMGEWKTKIVTPYHTLEVETLYNMAALSSLCQEPLPEMFRMEEEVDNDLYPRLNDLPF